MSCDTSDKPEHCFQCAKLRRKIEIMEQSAEELSYHGEIIKNKQPNRLTILNFVSILRIEVLIAKAR